MRRHLGPLFGGLILGLMAYTAWLTSDWPTLLACAPAILVTAAIVGGLIAGIVVFGTEETRLELVPQLAAPAPRNGRARAREERVVYNERKILGVLSGIAEVPAKHTRKKKRPMEVAQVLAACTGCGVCIPFCPVDCIEAESPARWPSRAIAPVRVRYDECIGCGICVNVCGKLAWDATVMRPTESIERELGIVIHDLPVDASARTSGF